MAFQRKKPAATGIKAPFPGFIEPALATFADKAPSGDRWIHDIKFDGYRVQVHLANTEIKVFTRRGHDWTHRFKKVASDVWPSQPAPRSSMAKLWYRPPTGPPTSQFFKTN